MLQMELRMGRAGNGTPVFTAAGQAPTFGRVFGAVWDRDRAFAPDLEAARRLFGRHVETAGAEAFGPPQAER